jgi:hypothetical protein
MTDQTTDTPQVQAPQPNLQLTLSVEAVNVILSALGKLPTESGVFPLRMMIAEQAQAQLNALVAQQSDDSGDSGASTADSSTDTAGE